MAGKYKPEKNDICLNDQIRLKLKFFRQKRREKNSTIVLLTILAKLGYEAHFIREFDEAHNIVHAHLFHNVDLMISNGVFA